MDTERQTWEIDFKIKEHALKGAKVREELAKMEVKELERSLREAKSEMNRRIKERKTIQKEVKTFWANKSSLLSRRRAWVKEHPGEALEAVLNL